MEKRAKEFLAIAERHYNENREKWDSLLSSIGMSFDEDVYNDTILRVYDKMLNDEDITTTEDEVMAYWYKSFVTNMRRHKKYAHNSKRVDEDAVELLKNKITVEPAHMYYPTMSMLLEKVRGRFSEESFHLFKFYYMSGYTYKEIEEIVGHYAKQRINKMRKWLKENV